jgi:hypothetical protein
MRSSIFAVVMLLSFVKVSQAQYTSKKIFRSCINFEYPVDISFFGPLAEIPAFGHSYVATYDTAHYFRLIEVNHFFNGRHLPVYNNSEDSYSGEILEYSLVASVKFTYDEKNRISNITMHDSKNNLCNNKWGTTQYSYIYSSPSSFNGLEQRYFINYPEVQTPQKKPLSLQKRHPFLLEFQLVENKYWQRKKWFVGIRDTVLEYVEFHPNGAPKTVKGYSCNKYENNVNPNQSKTGYTLFMYDEKGWQVLSIVHSKDGKPYGKEARISTEISQNHTSFDFKTLKLSADNRLSDRKGGELYTTDSTFFATRIIGIDSSGSTPMEDGFYSEFQTSQNPTTLTTIFYIPKEWRSFYGNYKVIKRVSEYDSEGLLSDVRFFSDTTPYVNSRDTWYNEPYHEHYTYFKSSDFWNNEKIDSVLIKRKVKFEGSDDEERQETRAFDNVGFLKEIIKKDKGIEDEKESYEYAPNSLKLKEILPNSEKTYRYEYGPDNFTVIEKEMDRENNRVKSTKTLYRKNGNNYVPYEEIKTAEIDGKISWDEYEYSEFFNISLKTCVMKSTLVDAIGRVEKVGYRMANNDLYEIYYTYNSDLTQENYSIYEPNVSQVELRKNGKPDKDDNSIKKIYQLFDEHMNRIMYYHEKEDQKGRSFEKIDWWLGNKLLSDYLEKVLTRPIIIPKFEYNSVGLISKVTFWKVALGSGISSNVEINKDGMVRAQDDEGIHEYEITYDQFYNVQSIVSKDDSGERKRQRSGVCSLHFFHDKFGNLTHKYTKDIYGDIIEENITIQEFDASSYKDDHLVGEKHYQVVNNQFQKTRINDFHERIVSITSNDLGERIYVESYRDTNGTTIFKNGSYENRIKTNEMGDTISISYYNQQGYVSEDSLFRNLADSVYFAQKGWVKYALSENTKEFFDGLAGKYKEEIIYLNAKGEQQNNELGYSRAILCDSMPFYSYEKYFSSNGKLAFKGDSKQKYYVKKNRIIARESQGKIKLGEFEYEQYFLNEKSKQVTNLLGVSCIHSNTYWINGAKVVENSYFSNNGQKRIKDKNGVHKVQYYLKNSNFEFPSDTLAFVCFDKKNRVVSNKHGSFLNLFNDRFYELSEYQVSSFGFDTLMLTDKLKLDSVELNNSYCKLKCTYPNDFGGVYIDRNMKLVEESGKEYKLLKTIGIPIAYSENGVVAEESDDNGNISFYLFFEPLPHSNANYKLVENEYSSTAWNAKRFNIEIRIP